MIGAVAGKKGDRESWSGELIARGADPKAVDELEKLFTYHKWGKEPQNDADSTLAKEVNKNSDLGKVIRTQMGLEDQIYLYYSQTKNKHVDKLEDRAKEELKWMWDNGLGNNVAYDNMDQQWKAEYQYQFDKMRLPLRFYRKGDLDKPVISTSLNSEGAQSHSVTGSPQPQFTPNNSYSYEDLKKQRL